MADDRYREQAGWRGSGRSDSIFGGSERGGGGHEDRGFFERAGEQVRSWFGGDDRGGGGGEWDRQEPWGGGDYAAGSFGGGQGGHAQSWSEGHGRSGGGSSGVGSGRHPLDDHYRSWRDRQIAELDREYEEYCRHRQQQFETDFHSWRQTRQGGGSQSSGASAGPADTQATSTTTGGTGMGSDASFGSSNPDLEGGDAGSEGAPRTRTNQP